LPHHAHAGLTCLTDSTLVFLPLLNIGAASEGGKANCRMAGMKKPGWAGL
jgi:hypothetical protein